METAFEIIVSQTENKLAKVYGDLENHRLMYKDICIYDGEFHDNPLADFSGVEQLFPNQHKYSQNEWTSMFYTIYTNYARCVPKYCKHLNFIPAKNEDSNEFCCFYDFHHRRVILDIFLLFGYHAKLFTWDNPSFFMHKICDNCIVYKRWVV